MVGQDQVRQLECGDVACRWETGRSVRQMHGPWRDGKAYKGVNVLQKERMCVVQFVERDMDHQILL